MPLSKHLELGECTPAQPRPLGWAGGEYVMDPNCTNTNGLGMRRSRPTTPGRSRSRPSTPGRSRPEEYGDRILFNTTVEGLSARWAAAAGESVSAPSPLSSLSPHGLFDCSHLSPTRSSLDRMRVECPPPLPHTPPILSHAPPPPLLQLAPTQLAAASSVVTTVVGKQVVGFVDVMSNYGTRCVRTVATPTRERVRRGFGVQRTQTTPGALVTVTSINAHH
jgi:hypothetical protein